MSKGLLLVLGALIVLVAAVAVPSLLRARVSAGEAPWIGDTRTASPTSVQGFAYVAVPAEADTGRRAFCGDASGIVCFTPDGTMPKIVDGRCPVPACTILQ